MRPISRVALFLILGTQVFFWIRGDTLSLESEIQYDRVHSSPPVLQEEPKKSNCPSFSTHPSGHLEFIHIPKAGGTYIELLAAAHNVSWGACHYKSQLDKHGPCPPLPPVEERPSKRNAWTQSPEWHTPLNIRDEWPDWARDTGLFLTVRHPVDRVVSEYNFRKYNLAFNASMSNVRIQERLRYIRDDPPTGTYDSNGTSAQHNTYYKSGSHWIPQVEFLVPNVHILKVEDLSEELPCLLQAYGLDWDLPDTSSNPAKGHLNKDDLTQETLDLIAEVYAQDFASFGYKME